MKKLLICFLIILLSPFNVFALELEADVTKNAKSAVAMDVSTGQILYNKNANEISSVASLTKMMGLILIFESLENKVISLDEVITVSKNAKEMGGSQIWLEEGEKISINDLIKGITLASANDAMVAMAERISGTEEAFVKKMNNKVKEYGLKNTYFKNCTGLDEVGHYSSAYDMAIIAKNLLKYEDVLNFTSVYEDYIRKGTDNESWIVNTNKLVRFYDGVDGLKTGSTDEAGKCMAVTINKNNFRVIVVTLGYGDTNTRNSETSDLLDYIFNQYEGKILFKKNQVIQRVNVNKGKKDYVELFSKDDIILVNKKSDKNKKYDYRVVLNDMNLPIKKGDVLGRIEILDGKNIVLKKDLVTDKDIGKLNILELYLRNLRYSIANS